jgi:hypothetical protein
MTWTVGFVTVNAGQQWGQWFSWGSDQHAQYIAPNPLSPGGFLRIDNQSKKINDDGSVVYYLTFTNIGSVATNVNFQGGGLT